MKRKKWERTLLVLFLAGIMLLTGCTAKQGDGKAKLDPKNPTTVTIWHYYNGAQQEAFNALVNEFNETIGKEKGIIVESSSQGNVTDLENSVLDAVNHKVGTGEMPSVFAAYADTAYAVDKLGLAVDLSEYLSKEEQEKYIESYLKEGKFTSDSGLKIFPVAKSVELFMLNQTDWEKFQKATGAKESELSTIEGVTRVAQAYYEWTDSLTDTLNDGKAFFGRDAMANYFLIGARQLGVEIFSLQDGKPTLNFDKEIIRKIWDNYYIPYIKGYFSSTGRFRSDDIKTGNIISFVGSSSGATFFPDEVILNDNESYPIEMAAFACPKFEGGEDFAVQQGAGMVVTKSEEKEILASIEFLKWFTEDERNIRFSVESGYLPVTKTANNIQKIESTTNGGTSVSRSILSTSVDTVNQNTLYTPKAFENGTKSRNILEYSLSDKAAQDREVVVANLNGGMTLEEATAEFDNDETFDSWYEQTKASLEELVK